MNVNELISALDLEALNLCDGDKIIKDGYTCDLLSWVIGRALPDSAFITIMTNINVVAVAVLAEAACVIICENAELGEDFLSRASAQGVNVLRSNKNAFEISHEIYKLIK
jgi:hypothetical protein